MFLFIFSSIAVIAVGLYSYIHENNPFGLLIAGVMFVGFSLEIIDLFDNE